jgi:hypothetical protein
MVSSGSAVCTVALLLRGLDFAEKHTQPPSAREKRASHDTGALGNWAPLRCRCARLWTVVVLDAASDATMPAWMIIVSATVAVYYA